MIASERADVLLERARKKRAALFESFGGAAACRPEDVKTALIVDAASRSGSSYLYRLLSRHPDVVSLNGESGVFARLHGLSAVRSLQDSDAVPVAGAPAEALRAAAQDILSDSGTLFSGAGSGFPKETFLTDCAQRLLLQYPEADFEPEALRRACEEAFETGPFALPDGWKRLLAALKESFPVDASHYDLGGTLRPAGAPPPFTALALEEPPFIVPRPRVRPSARDLAAKTLLLKSTSDCYRMELLRRMFPAARLRFVVLTRNPAAAISGLIDGWLSDAFQSHDVGRFASLDVAGYSRDDRPWTRRWWKFDLPPGWADLRAKPLEKVCAFQWLSANRRIAADVRSGLLSERVTARYEALLDPRSRAAELERILDFAGLRRAPGLEEGGAVMAVTPPAAGKWRKRRDVLAPIVSRGEVAAMAEELGYAPAAWEALP